MICIDSSGNNVLHIEKHRPTYTTVRLDVIRSIDSSMVYSTTSVLEGEFYFTALLNTSGMAQGQYQYNIVNPTTNKVYETGLLFINSRQNPNENNIITYEG